MTIIQERVSQISSMSLHAGAHDANDDGAMCAMEMVAWIAGEPWSDHPQCACPVLSAFMRNWNDSLSDDDRTKLLLPFIPRLVGTKGSKALEARRATMAADWYVRTFTPAWLRLAGLSDHADTLASFPEITSFEKAPSIRAALEGASKDASAAGSAAWSAARSAAESAAWSAAESAAESAAGSAAWSAAGSAAGSAAWSAAESAAWSAARSAAWSAAWSAARSAAWEAAESAARSAARSAADSAAESAAWSAAESAAWSAAESAAWSAARSAAESAAWSAAGSAAGSALKPTCDQLQASALDLLNRMIDEKEAA